MFRSTTLAAAALVLALAGCQGPTAGGSLTAAFGTGDAAKTAVGAATGGQTGQTGQNGQGGNGTTPTQINNSGAKKSVTGINVTPPGPLVISTATKQQLKGFVNYTDGTQDTNVSWSSNDSSIVAINATTGDVTANGVGTATITAAAVADPKQISTVSFTVKQSATGIAVVTVTPATSQINVGDTVKLSAKVKMTDATESADVRWDSSDPSKATVNDGLVIGIAAGTVTITATAAQDATKKASSTITVKAAQ